MQGFCTKCGQPLQADARFCTACGAPVSGHAVRPAAEAPKPANAIAAGALLVAIGGVAAYFALSGPAHPPRAVPGSPGQAPASAAATAEGGLPTGHPSIELPKEVVDFLDGLTAEAEKNPQDIEAVRKLAHARYRASVINGSYRASAEQALARLLALDPDDQEGLRISANLAYDAGDFAAAETRFRTFLAKYPDDASALTDLGSSLLFQNKLDEALETYHAAIGKDPKFMQAHFNLGIALQKQGKKDEAIASLRRSFELAGTPEEKQHVENAIAELEGRSPTAIAGAKNAPGAGTAPSAAGSGAPSASGGAPGSQPADAPGGMQGGMPMPPQAPDRVVPTNASTDFQRQSEKPLITHPIVGPRVVSFEWKNQSQASVKIEDFPMDRMPPFARTKFKATISDRIGEVAARNAVSGPLQIELIDAATGNVMDTIDVAASSGAAAR